MSGFNTTNSGRTSDAPNPHGVPNPVRKATKNATAPFVYARRYLDWNRYTFQYHAVGAADASHNATFDTQPGLNTTAHISDIRTQQRLGTVYGCVPAFYCQTCVPFGSATSIFTLLTDALSAVVVRPGRADRPRMIFSSTGGVRFDLFKGPFTYDDSFIVSPFRNVFVYLPDVPYAAASQLLAGLNDDIVNKRSSRYLAGASEASLFGGNACVDPVIGATSGIMRRQVQETSGYTTKDDFGTDGGCRPVCMGSKKKKGEQKRQLTNR